MLFRRGFAGLSRAQERKREAMAKLRQPAVRAETQNAGGMKFSTVLKQLYKRTHPDLLRSKCATSAEHNDKSWQVLNGILSTVKESGGGSYPPAINQQVKLFMSSPSGLEPVELRIQTAGGDCRRSLTKSFSELFVNAKLLKPDDSIVWDDDYFRPVLDNGRLRD